MFTRADERASAAAYERLWRRGSAGAVFERFLMGPVGVFLCNTPLFLLPGRLPIDAGQRLLEIGCGRGAGLRLLASRVAFRQPAVGIDISAAALELARREGGARTRVELAAAAATRLPFAAASFDLILTTYMVHHLGDQAMHRFLFECHRALRPGGRLVIWDFAPTRSRRLNRLHAWLLTRQVGVAARLRGYGDFVDIAIESPFTNLELLKLRPFLFPPIPRTALLLTKGAGSRDEA